MLRTRKELIEDQHTGRLYIRYTPYLEVTGPCASGQLSFACWEAEVGESDAVHLKAKRDALISAARVIAEIADDVEAAYPPLHARDTNAKATAR